MIKLREIPNSSGVYIFKVNNEIIYIGSSNNLYQRIATHNTYISKGSNAKCNPALYQFLQTNPFTVEFQLTDNYRELEHDLIDQYHPKYNAIRANTGLGAYKGRKAEYAKEYRETYRKEILEHQNQYRDSHREEKKQYQSEALSLNALRTRFRRQCIEHPTIEAKKYLI